MNAIKERQMIEEELYLRRNHAIFPEEIRDAMSRVFPGMIVPMHSRKNPEATDLVARRTGKVSAKVTKIVGHIIEFDNGCSCTDKEWTAYIRDPSIPIGGHFR